MSRPLHLSRISSSYALGGAPTATGDDGEDSSHTGIGGVTSHALPPDLLAAAAAEEEENEFDRMEEGAGGGEIDEGAPDEHDGDNEHISREELAEGGADQEHDQEGETDHSHAGAAYQTATEIDPYSMSQSTSSLYPSGLLGLSAAEETSRDSHADDPTDSAVATAAPSEPLSDVDEDGRGADDPYDSMPHHDISAYDAAHPPDMMDQDEYDVTSAERQFDDEDGWVGSFRAHSDDDDLHAHHLREQDAQAQFERRRDAEDGGDEQHDEAEPHESDPVYHDDDNDDMEHNESASRRSGSEEEERDEEDRDDAAAAAEEEEEEERIDDPATAGLDDDAPDATPTLYHSSQSGPFLPPPAPASIYASYAPTTPIATHKNNTSLPYGSAAAAAAAHMSLAAAHHFAAASPSASSPMYAYSPRHSASFSPSHSHLGPTSPRIHSHYYASAPFGSMSAGASSPRQDTIASVTHRVEHMQRSGRLASLLHTASRFNQEVAGAAAAAQSMPDYRNLSSQANAARTSCKQALIAIDQHLLRRYIFGVLDSDMIVRGVVANKNSSVGLVINIAEIVWPNDKAREVLARQQQAAINVIASMQGQKDTAEKATKTGTTGAQHYFPPLSSFLGGIHGPAGTATATATGTANMVTTASSSLPSDLDATYATEQTLFSNFEVLAIHGDCHLAELHTPAPMATGDAAVAAALAGTHTPSLERFSLGDQVKALVISVDIHSEKVYLSMNQNRLRGPVATTHKLGVIPKEQAQTNAGANSGKVADGEASKSASIAMTTHASQQGTDTPIEPSKKGDANSTPSAIATGQTPSHSSTPAAGITTNPTSSWAYSSYLKGNGSTTPTHPPPPTPSSTLPTHMLKSRGGLGSKPPVAPSLAILGNPLLLAKARNFLQFLHDQPLFKNPEGINKLTTCYHVHQYGTLTKKTSLSPSNLYHSLRHAQNQSWAKESVVKGISLAKKGSFENAMKCYKHALDIEPNFTQAFVARGAAYVLQGAMKKAIAEFEHALQIDPHQPYALTYLQAAKDKLMGPTKQPTAATSSTPTSTTLPSTAAHSSRDADSSPRARRSSPRSRDRSSRRDAGSKKHKKEKKSRRRRSTDEGRSSTPSSDDDDDDDDDDADRASESRSSRRRSKSDKKSRKRDRESDKSSRKKKKHKKSKRDDPPSTSRRSEPTATAATRTDSHERSDTSERSRSSSDGTPAASGEVYAASSVTPPASGSATRGEAGRSNSQTRTGTGAEPASSHSITRDASSASSSSSSDEWLAGGTARRASDVGSEPLSSATVPRPRTAPSPPPTPPPDLHEDKEHLFLPAEDAGDPFAPLASPTVHPFVAAEADAALYTADGEDDIDQHDADGGVDNAVAQSHEFVLPSPDAIDASAGLGSQTDSQSTKHSHIDE